MCTHLVGKLLSDWLQAACVPMQDAPVFVRRSNQSFAHRVHGNVRNRATVTPENTHRFGRFPGVPHHQTPVTCSSEKNVTVQPPRDLAYLCSVIVHGTQARAGARVPQLDVSILSSRKNQWLRGMPFARLNAPMMVECPLNLTSLEIEDFGG
jgi:hypothetical protein